MIVSGCDVGALATKTVILNRRLFIGVGYNRQ